MNGISGLMRRDTREMTSFSPHADKARFTKTALVVWGISHVSTNLTGLKPSAFGHPMRRTDSLEKTLMLGKTEGRRRRPQGSNLHHLCLMKWQEGSLPLAPLR